MSLDQDNARRQQLAAELEAARQRAAADLAAAEEAARRLAETIARATQTS